MHIQPEHPKDCEKVPLTLPVSGTVVLIAKYRMLTGDLDLIASLAGDKAGKGRSMAAEASLLTFREDGAFIPMEEVLKWPLEDTLAVFAEREKAGFFASAPTPAPGAWMPLP